MRILFLNDLSDPRIGSSVRQMYEHGAELRRRGHETALVTALNKDTQALHHELVPFDRSVAQALSDKAVDVLRAAQAGELPPRIATSPDFFLCRFCPYSARCWEDRP